MFRRFLTLMVCFNAGLKRLYKPTMPVDVFGMDDMNQAAVFIYVNVPYVSLLLD